MIKSTNATQGWVIRVLVRVKVKYIRRAEWIRKIFWRAFFVGK